MLSTSRYSSGLWALPPTGPVAQMVGVPTAAEVRDAETVQRSHGDVVAHAPLAQHGSQDVGRELLSIGCYRVAAAGGKFAQHSNAAIESFQLMEAIFDQPADHDGMLVLDNDGGLNRSL